MSFADEIEEVNHSELLSSGNLNKKREYVLITPRWTPEAYIARVLTQVCSCGSQTPSGVFLYLRSRDQEGLMRLEQIPPGLLPLPIPHLTESLTQPRDVCFQCLPRLGFNP